MVGFDSGIEAKTQKKLVGHPPWSNSSSESKKPNENGAQIKMGVLIEHPS
jgi:hypothetical protein